MNGISVVINTLNEEENLPRALSSVKDLADEIIVVDAMSKDTTVEVAKEAGAKVYLYKKPVTYVEPARNFAINKATHDWILILDADEKITPQLAKKLKKITREKKASYIRIPRKNIVFGKWLKHSRWWPDYNIRFFKKGHVTWNEVIHSVPLTTGKGVDLPDKEKYAVIHYHYVSLEQYVERMNRYTTEHAKLRIKDGYKFKWRDIIRKPAGEFLSRYFFGRGYKDGLHGLAVSSLQAFSELVLYLKIWQMKGFKKKKVKVKSVIETMRQVESELHYWQADARIDEGAGIVQRIKRKFMLP
jgi:(heptosyl)LPS beta-1,4-glucosyltransferase